VHAFCNTVYTLKHTHVLLTFIVSFTFKYFNHYPHSKILFYFETILNISQKCSDSSMGQTINHLFLASLPGGPYLIFWHTKMMFCSEIFAWIIYYPKSITVWFVFYFWIVSGRLTNVTPPAQHSLSRSRLRRIIGTGRPTIISLVLVFCSVFCLCTLRLFYFLILISVKFLQFSLFFVDFNWIYSRSHFSALTPD